MKKQNLNVMEKTLPIFSSENLNDYLTSNNLCAHERETVQEITDTVKCSDQEKINWFMQFGARMHHILLNCHANRKGLEYGFTEMLFDEYGWLKRPQFLEIEELEFGKLDKNRFGNFSCISLGRGLNHS